MNWQTDAAEGEAEEQASVSLCKGTSFLAQT